MIVLTLALNLCYCLLAAIALPMVAWKRFQTGKYRHGWGQKLFGTLPETTDRKRPRVWLHAVSVGEVLQLRQIIDRLKAARPDVSILISTTTETGHTVAVEKFPGCDVAFFPLDFSWSVRNAIRRVAPDLIILVELELWPNFILTANSNRIPLALINGRLSSRSFNGYGRIRPLVKKLLEGFSVIGVQTEEYRERFIQLGADPQCTHLTGSIKFDGVSTDPTRPLTRDLADWMKLPEPASVLIAGSTQAPEEDYILRAYTAILPQFPKLKLILAPRHPERRNEVIDLIQRAGFPVRQRSTRQILSPAGNVIQAGSRDALSKTFDADLERPAIGLLDTVGELGACWGLAEIAFVGGSFTSRGGQNMLEPAAFGAAVCFGPNTWNFKQVVELLLSRDAARTVRTPEALQQFISEMLSSPLEAERMGERAQSLVLSQQGATDRTIELLLQLLSPLASMQQSAEQQVA